MTIQGAAAIVYAGIDGTPLLEGLALDECLLGELEELEESKVWACGMKSFGPQATGVVRYTSETAAITARKYWALRGCTPAGNPTAETLSDALQWAKQKGYRCLLLRDECMTTVAEYPV